MGGGWGGGGHGPGEGHQVMGKSTSGGNKKSPKTNQPKRKRYNSERRGFKRRYRDLEAHVAKHPNDSVAPTALSRVRALVYGA
jgi:hypothetical protein